MTVIQNSRVTTSGDAHPSRSASTLSRRDGFLEPYPTRLLTERLGTGSTLRRAPSKDHGIKIIFTRSHCLLWSIVAGATLFALVAAAKELTAFELAKEGNRYIGEQSKDKVVQIRSEKSVASMTPDIWYVVYHDPDAVLKAVEVKFGAGQKMDVKRPVRLLEPIVKADEPLPKEKLKIDSDKALAIATQQPLLSNLKLKASRLILERRSAEDSAPVWKVRLWAARLKNPKENADIGQVMISAEDGMVLKSELKPEHVD